MEVHADSREHRTRRILIVDDDDDATDMLSQILERSGYVTRHAADGATALEVAAEFHPDLVLLDIGLPSMSGIEVASALRHSPGGAEMRIVALSGREPEDLPPGEGFDAWLVKPTSLERLRELLA